MSKAGTNANAHPQENEATVAYSHKAMPHSYRKNITLGHVTIERNLTEMLSKRSQTQEYLLSNCRYTELKKRYNQVTKTDVKMLVPSGEYRLGRTEGTPGGHTDVLYLNLGG